MKLNEEKKVDIYGKVYDTKTDKGSSTEINYEKLTGSQWYDLLFDEPLLADKCDWKKLDGFDTASLVQMHPQLAKYSGILFKF
jgi:hypothetical protein